MLRTIGNTRATKLWRWNPTLGQWSKISYAAGSWFMPREHVVTDLNELVAVLDQVRSDPTAFVVRGALTPEARAALAADRRHTIRRRKHKKNDVDPSLVETPRHWLMADIDGWPLPPWGDLADDPETAIDAAVHELLPPAFHDARCWWQLSSSAGFSGNTLKVHLFFWLAEAADNRHIKLVLEQHAPGVDRAPFNAAQPHYIADPIIEGGHDPMPRRTGWRQGLEDEVVLPALKPAERKTASSASSLGSRSGGIEDALSVLGHGEGGQGFHQPIRVAVMRYARQCVRSGTRDDAAFKTWLRERIRSAPCRPGGDVENPYCQDFYLDASIAGAFALLAADPDVQAMRPHHAAETRTLAEARRELQQEVGSFFDRALAWHALPEEERESTPAEHGALIVGVGIGKSTSARMQLPRFIAEAKAAGTPHRVLWLVPHHRLSNEAVELMKGIGLLAMVWRGRDADDPFTGDPEADIKPQPMCLNQDAVRDAIMIQHVIEKTVCGNPQGDKPRCAWRVGEGRCGYQRQKAPAARVDVVIAAHAVMFHDLPKEIADGLGLVVVDESWWQGGLTPNRDVPLAGFAQVPLEFPVLSREKVTAKSFRWVRNEFATNELHEISLKAKAGFDAMPDGEFASKATFLAAGLTVDDCAIAHKHEWARKMDGAIYPGQPAEERKKMVDHAIGNATIPRRAGIWKALEALLRSDETHTGRLQVETRQSKEGPFRAIVLHTRLDIKEDITALPMLLLDATMPIEAVRRYLPRVEVLAEVQAMTPHMTVHQVIGGWGKTSLVPGSRALPAENARRSALVREVADFVGLNSGGNALAVTYLAIEEVFEGRPGIRTGHFNAMAGLDSYGDVRTLAIVGRPLPDARDLHVAALALTGRAIPPEKGHMETRGALMADGTGVAVNVRVYTDPDLEALRTAIAEAEVIQIAGRGRAVNRAAETPLDLFIFADVVVPLPINRLVRWHDIRPSVVGRMLGRRAAMLSPSDAAKAYPDIFPTVEAAKKALQRTAGGGDFGDIPLGLYILREMSPKYPLLASYRPVGRGQQKRSARVLPWQADGFGEWLQSLLGELAFYELIDPLPAARPEPEQSMAKPPTLPSQVFPPAELLVVRRAGERPIQIMPCDGPLPAFLKAMGEYAPAVLPEWVGVRLGRDEALWSHV